MLGSNLGSVPSDAVGRAASNLPSSLSFANFTLDRARCALLRGTEQIGLRRQSFDLLCFLAENAGCVVGKDKLLAAVWPGVCVTDDSLVQCIGDIRQALGDARHQIIKTVPRRGYMLAATVTTASPPEPKELLAGLSPDDQSVASRIVTAVAHRPLSSVMAGLLLTVLVGSVGLWGRNQGADPPVVQLANGAADHRSVALNGPAASSLPAATAPERRVALVIGNGRYIKGGMLANPARDAEGLARALRRIGFTRVTLQLDLSREHFLQALDRFAGEAAEADWAVIYFAGRGFEIDGTSYLMPIDSPLSSPREISSQAISLDRMLQVTDSARKLRLIILDACRENPIALNSTPTAGEMRKVEEAIAAHTLSGATLVAYAAKHGQRAEDGAGENSPFAHALIKTIEISGLEIGHVFRKVRDDVLQATHRRQEPFLYGSLPAEPFFFRRP